jgi:hypothetical protein
MTLHGHAIMTLRRRHLLQRCAVVTLCHCDGVSLFRYNGIE